MDYDEIIDRFDDDLGPSPDDIEAWAAREHRRRQEWVNGPTERERLMWARRERLRRIERETRDSACGPSRPDPGRTSSQSAREFQLAAQGAAAELLSFPFRLFDAFVASGRDVERASSRPRDLRDFDDELG